MQTLYDTVISNLKGVVGSNKDGISLNSITSEYEFITGDRFPINELGYNSIFSFLKSVPHLFKVQKCAGGITRIFNVIGKNESESNLILYDMIKNTNPKKGPKFRKLPFLYNRNHQGFPPFSNFTYSNNSNNLTGFNTPGITKFDNNSSRTFDNFQIQVHVNQNNDAFNDPNVYEISSDSESSDDTSIECNTSVVSIQTTEIEYTRITTSISSLKSLEFVGFVVDIIVEFKPLNLDNVVFFKIRSDLYYYFNLFTGLNLDPCLFNDIVLNVLSSLKCEELYEDLIYPDTSGKYCCLNLSTTKYTLTHLPYLEFNMNTSFEVEVMVVSSDGICAVRFSEDSSDLLRWSKSRPLSDQAKVVIENQQFWSWIPGSLCLVQLPDNLVKSLRLSSVERAIIVSTEIASPTDAQKHKCWRQILHKSSFYLIDHKRYISSMPSLSSSFQVVKRSAYRTNDTNIAYVCNVSIRARCMPSKIQYIKINNFKDVSQILYNKRGDFLPNKHLIIYQVHRTSLMMNFQPVFECYSRINKNDLDTNRVLEKYDDYVVECPGKKINNKVEKKVNSEEIEVIVISDSEEDEVELKSKTKHDSDMSISSTEDEPILVRNHLKTLTNGNSSKISTSEVKTAIDINQLMNSISKKESEDDKISVISFTDDELQEKISISSSNSDIEETDNENIENIQNIDNITLESEIVPETKKPEKCIIPISTDLCHYFHEKIVKIMYIQSGSAVIGLLETTALMKRELKMMSLIHQDLFGVINQISIGDYYLWCCNVEIEYIKDKKIVLVEVLQVIQKDMALVSLVHYGLVTTVKRDDLRHIPNFNNNSGSGGSNSSDLQDLIGPIIGAFDLHMVPNWYSTELDTSLTDQLFTAYFINENELVLEYFDDPCKFFNLQLIETIVNDLNNNHCNIRSKSFITTLSEALLNCRLFVGDLLVLMTTYNDSSSVGYSLPITNTLVQITEDDEPGVWFASIDVENEFGDLIKKLSPNCFAEGKFCIDRVQINKSKNQLQLLDYQNIHVDIPENFLGLYKFDKSLLNVFNKSNAEFLSRYMLIGASEIPDLTYLLNKLIF